MFGLFGSKNRRRAPLRTRLHNARKRVASLARRMRHGKRTRHRGRAMYRRRRHRSY